MNEQLNNALLVAKNLTANTIGYHESENKKEFDKGVKIFIDKFLPLLQPIIEMKDREIQSKQEELNKIKETIANFKDLFLGRTN